MKIFTNRGLTRHEEKLWREFDKQNQLRQELNDIHTNIFEIRQKITELERKLNPEKKDAKCVEVHDVVDI